MSNLLNYTEGASVLHRLNPLTKIALAVCLCVAGFISGNIFTILFLLLCSISLGLVGGLYRKTLTLVLGLTQISVFLFLLQILFIRTGTPVLLFITDEGLRVALFVVLRLMNATIPLALMLALTRISDLSNALVKVLRLPYRYAFTTSLRFIPVFADDMAAIMAAQTARGVNFDTKNPLRKLRLMLPLCVPLLVTSVGRTEQAAMAAEVRGFYLRTRTSGSKEYPFKALDAVVFVLAIALVVLAVFL